jgi:hypothetical protein
MGSNERDWRVDMWRGFAIAMIFVNHIPGNIVSFLTSRNWGFSDGAELFVFLSGLSIAHVLTTRFSNNRNGALFYLASRSFVLYVSHLGLLLAVAAVCAAYLEMTQSDTLIQQMLLGPFFSETEFVIRRIITLTYLPEFMDILPLYIVVIGIAGLMFVAFRRRWQLYILTSFTLYSAATYWNFDLPDYPAGRTWYFNPFCWQLVFISGFVVVLVRDKSWFRHALQARPLMFLSMTMVALGVAGSAPWAYQELVFKWRPLDSIVAPLLDKQNVSPLRYVHFLACAHVAYLILHKGSPIRTSPIGRMLCVIGRNSLPTFALATVMSTCARAYLGFSGDDVLGQVTITALGLCVIAVFAMLLHRAKTEMRYAGPAPAFAK